MPILNRKVRSMAALLATICLSHFGAQAQKIAHSSSPHNGAGQSGTTVEVAPGTRVTTIVLGTVNHNRAKATADNKVLPTVESSSLAGVLASLPSTLSNGNLASFIADWYGTRYRYGGTGRSGIDCSAFVQKLYENVFGVSLVRTAIQQAQNACALCTNDDLREGDLVFFKTQGSRISHVGVFLWNKFFVHSASSKGVMISSLDDKYWKPRYAGAGRVL
jgi:cell wall-associated NlpC family hydrolase